MHLPRSARTLALAALSGLVTHATAQSVNMSRSLRLAPISLHGQSVWPNGESTGSNLSPIFIGPSWDLTGKSIDAYGDLTIPAINWGLFTTPAFDLGRTGFQVKYGGTGKAGFNVKPYYIGGAMDLTYTGNVTVSGLPSRPQPGQSITLKLVYGTTTNSHFQVSSPDTGVGVDAQFQLSGNASSTGWFLGDTVWNGNLFTPFDSGLQTATIFPMTSLSDNSVAQLASKLSFATNVASPISVNVSVPDLSVVGDTVETSTHALTGTTFATFCSVQTDMLSWLLELIPGAKQTIGSFALNGYLPIGPAANVQWSFAKIYANMNLGFRSTYKLLPAATLGVDVYKADANGVETKIATSSTDTVSFTMPNARIHVVPRVSLDLSLQSDLAFGIGGEIGTSPFAASFDGTLGSGSRASAEHFSVDPAHLSYNLGDADAAKIKHANFVVAHTDQTVDGGFLRPLNLNTLPPHVYPGSVSQDVIDGDNVPLVVPAFSLDPETDSTPIFTAYLSPEQGYLFFDGSRADVAVEDSSGTGPAGFSPSVIVRPEVITLQFHSSDLKPGRYILHTYIYGQDLNDASKKTQYRTPFNVVYAKGIFDGKFYLNGDPAYNINRIVADGTEHEIAVVARHLYHDTEIVMNGDTVLPRSGTTDEANAISDGQQVQISVPPEVARRFAGQINTIQLRTPDLSGDGSGFILSEPKNLFIVAGAPTLSGTKYNNVANATLPLGSQAVSFEADGTNLSQATTLSAIWTRDGVQTTTPVPALYVSSTALRATLSTDFLADFHSHSSNGSLSIQATTPTAVVEGDHYNLQTLTSGGTSTLLNVKLVHLKPTITRLDSGILIDNSGVRTYNVYGDNLLRDPSAFYARDLAVGFASGVGATVTYPAGTGLSVPYLTVTLPANSPALSQPYPVHNVVSYRDAASAPVDLLIEYGAPSLNTGTTYQLVMGASGADLPLTGAPFYDGVTHVLLNGNELNYLQVLSPTSGTVHVPQTVTGATASVQVANPSPGGGTSNAVSVALLEGDASTVKVVPGALVFDRASNTYRQSFAVTYNGSHNVAQGARIVFGNVLAGVTLTNASGTVNGKPYLTTSLVPRRQVTVVAAWRKGSSNPIDPSNSVAFPY